MKIQYMGRENGLYWGDKLAVISYAPFIEDFNKIQTIKKFLEIKGFKLRFDDRLHGVVGFKVENKTEYKTLVNHYKTMKKFVLNEEKMRKRVF